KLIHDLTIGDEGPFVQLNVGQIPASLLESELFGTTKGAFTGATDKVGYLVKANGGTLFLDEIDSLPKSSQVKIQVALEEWKFQRLGSSKEIHSKFRLITATCNDLYGLIRSNNLREDFFYRIKGYEVHIPPLRQRSSDIESITRHLVKDLPFEMVFTSDACAALRSFDWPGNIRQLKDFILSFQATGQNYIDRLSVIEGLNRYNDTDQSIQTQNVLTSKQKEIIQQKGLQYLIDLIEEQA